jgi:hypothetical protein
MIWLQGRDGRGEKGATHSSIRARASAFPTTGYGLLKPERETQPSFGCSLSSDRPGFEQCRPSELAPVHGAGAGEGSDARRNVRRHREWRPAVPAPARGQRDRSSRSTPRTGLRGRASDCSECGDDEFAPGQPLLLSFMCNRNGREATLLMTISLPRDSRENRLKMIGDRS